MNLLKTCLFTSFLSISIHAHATVESFGALQAGTYTPASSFASLTYSASANIYTFTLKANDLNALFTSGAFIRSIAVNTSPDIQLNGKNAPTVTVSNLSGGVTTLEAANGSGPTGVYDFRFDIGKGSDRLTANETVTWTAAFSTPVTFKGLSIHVQGLTQAQGDSAWYIPAVTAAVPEPENSALFLLGLGVVGVTLRKRAQ